MKEISIKGCQFAYQVIGEESRNVTNAENEARPLNKIVPRASGWADRGTQETSAVFRARFRRCHRLLHFIACRVLGSPEGADDAIENCWLKASRNPPCFEYESAFRSWLVRVLIDEALAILQEKRHTQNAGVSPDSIPEQVFEGRRGRRGKQNSAQRLTREAAIPKTRDRSVYSHPRLSVKTT